MRPTRKTMPFQRRSSRETALLMHIRFSLLMLNHRAEDEDLKRLKTRCLALEDHLNNYMPSSWFRRLFSSGPVFYAGMLISATEDQNGWHVAPLRGMRSENAEESAA
jgi:hypothetical protein